MSEAWRRDQLSFEESVLYDPALLLLLDVREAAKDARAVAGREATQAQSRWSAADKATREALEGLELRPGTHRCGRYVIRISEEKRLILDIEKGEAP